MASPTGTVILAYTAAIQPNGRILLGGARLSCGAPTQALTRLLPDGSPDSSFAITQSPQGTAFALGVQPNGALLVGGQFAPSLSQPNFFLIRLLDANTLRLNAS